MTLRLTLLPLILSILLIMVSCTKQTISDSRPILADGKKSLLREDTSCNLLPACFATAVNRAGDRPLQVFNRVNGTDGKPISLAARVTTYYNLLLELNITYYGNVMLMQYADNGDTAMIATLDECGRVIRSDYRDFWFPAGLYLTYYYNYNNQGRLAHFGEVNDSSEFMLSYDVHGNVLSLASRNGRSWLQFRYDTTRPVKGGIVYTETRHNDLTPISLLEWSGHLDLKPRSLRTFTNSGTGDISWEAWTYENQLVENGNLVSYQENHPLRKTDVNATFQCK